MTENKRFEMKDPNCWGYPITDNKTGTVYNCNSNIWMKELVGVLNALNDENEQLKSELGKLNILYKAKCKTEEQLIKMGKEVEKENEQLKKENQRLDDILGKECINEYSKLLGDTILKEMYDEKYGGKE